ncbi:type IV pilus biogenesis/stability protein PilW [Marinobacter fonticola]|uniref:type IV pilus biogenesis/stability protein PilW n=1 Tax=Marinobacter fonticola TaxID=2603215 RepID=UPI0011E809CF|nr:type IV pilus biogenesis/stability protein PilW [Marinobacter fonticola]
MIVRLLLLFGSLTLAGCVTTSNSPFAREADQQKAVKNYVRLGTAYVSQGNYERARDHLQRALELDEDSAGALAAMGLIYQQEGEGELAEQSFRKAVDSDPDYTRGRLFYGAFLYGQGQYEDAREQFSRASQDTDFNDRGSIFYNLGRTQDQLGEYEAAVKSYRRAADLTRGNANYLLALSTALIRQGEYDEAQRYYERLAGMIQRDPKLSHSPESLLTGLKLAHFYGDRHREASLALLLRNQYPESEQLKQYRALISNE